MFAKLINHINIIKENRRKNKLKISEEELCKKYKNTNASNGYCLGFSSDWRESHHKCRNCPVFHLNIIE